MEKRAIVLLVEDDRTLLSILERTLREGTPYQVLTARDGAEALTIAEEHIPDVILSDYYMPGMDGFGLCKEVKNHRVLRETMFMLLTSATEIDIKVKGFESGADDYLTKPFLTEELLARIKALLRLKNLQDELKVGKSELARLNSELEESFTGVVKILMDLIELKVPHASIRGQRGVEISRWIGQRLECSADELRQLENAARLHEIGKIRLSEETLRKKESELTQTERAALAQFPVYGELILKTVPKLKEVSLILRHQMENYDGTGFPDKLLKDEIPAFSHIVRTVNFLEHAFTQGITTADGLIDELHKERGMQLDPRIAQLAEEYIRVIDDPSWLDNKRQVSVYELAEGMVIATDLCTGNGVKLLSKNTKISASIIERILSHHQVDPIVNLVYVYL